MSIQLPSPPFLHIEGISNFRDIGAYDCADGQHVIRRALIYRSADPSHATEAGLKRMQELGIQKIFDLRSAPEIRRDGPEWKDVEVREMQIGKEYGMERTWVPVFADQDYGPEQVALRYKNYTKTGSEGFVSAYHDILTNGRPAYKTILLHLAEPDPAPCLIHCTAGKDRTGIFVALLFLLAGVDNSTIAEEYSLTDLGLHDLKPLFIERLLKNPALSGNRDGVANMISSKKQNMEASIEMIKKDHGGAEQYVRTCGLSDEEVKRLKKNLVEPKP